MKCVDCEHFKIKYEPYKSGGILLNFGMAECDKHNLVVDFASHRKLNKLECVENEPGQSNRTR